MWVSEAVVHVGDPKGPRHSHTLEVRGMGKYPYINTSQSRLDFGEVLINPASPGVEQSFTLTNHTIVHATFAIERYDNDAEEALELCL